MRQHHLMLGWILAFIGASGLCVDVSPARAQSMPGRSDEKDAPVFSGPFDPTHGRPLMVADDPDSSVLWTFASLVPGTANHEVRTYHVRYCVQSLGGSKGPQEVFDDLEQGYGGNGTILADGSVLLTHMHRIVWAKASQPPREEPWPQVDQYDVGPVALYPDGIVGEEYRPSESGAKTWWIPIEGHALKMSARVQLDRDVPSIAKFVRFQKQIAWLNAPQITDNTPPRQRKKPTFCVFDITTGKVDRMPVKVNDDSSLEAFDGKHAVGGGMLIDLSTRTTTPLNIPGDIIGIASNTIYAIQMAKPATFMSSPDSADILAVALDNPANPRVLAHIDLTKARGPNQQGWISPRNCALLTAEGLRIWESQRWIPTK
jgi:hypothetical protein